MTDIPTTPIWQAVRDHVAARAAGLQGGLLSDSPGRQAEARAQLAVLRHSRADDPSDPAAWPITLAGLPGNLLGAPDTDGPSRAERAVHGALVTFGLHMQSARAPRHVPGQRLGRSVRQLADAKAADTAVVKRFHTFATATSWPQRMHHLRGLVSLMRSAEIALDYGSLAADLYFVQAREGLQRARLQWGRDFHRAPSTTKPAAGSQESTATAGTTTTTTTTTITDTKES